MKRNALFVLLLALIVFALGCEQKTVNPRPAPPPPPPYSGPDFLQTTIGSMTSVRGYQPQLVSGFGLVAGLRHTGSPDCPPALRAWFLNQMAAKGFGRESLGFGNLTPAEVLASDTTAIVIVEAIIPPGATKNSRFDVVVTAMPGTSTSSLEGGRLYTTDLRLFGADPAHPTSQILASASGDLFLNPFNVANIDQASGTLISSPNTLTTSDPRSARILSGGQVLVTPIVALQLNQPSYLRSRQIADRINARFPQMPGDREPLAVAKTDQLIQINILSAYKNDPKRLIELINGLFIDPTDTFNRSKALELRAILEKPENQQYAPQITLAWQAMGRSQLPFLRDIYDHSDPVVRFAALEAAARLGDLNAADHLFKLAVTKNSPYCDRAVALLGYILRQHPEHIRLATMLRQLLDADDALIRLTAFDALANVGDPFIQIRPFDQKFELAFVPSTKPMIYVSRTGTPRIVVFDPDIAFTQPLLYANDDNSFMLRRSPEDTHLNVFYRAPDQVRGSTTQLLPLVTNLIYLMGNRPTDKNPTAGFNFTYSQVVHQLYLLSQARTFNAPIVLQPSTLIQSIAAQKQATIPTDRPESVTPAPNTQSPPSPSPSSPATTPDPSKPIRWRDIPSENSNSPVAPTPSTGDNPTTE